VSLQPAIPAFAKTIHALDLTAIVIGFKNLVLYNIKRLKRHFVSKIYAFHRPENDAFPWKNPDGAHAVVYHITVNKCM
jgi:hypothetical protein